MRGDGSSKTPNSDLDLSLFEGSESLEALTVRFREPTLDLIRAIADDHNLGQAEVVRRLVDEGIASISNSISVKPAQTQNQDSSNSSLKGMGD
jgi:hypothetical protein